MTKRGNTMRNAMLALRRRMRQVNDRAADRGASAIEWVVIAAVAVGIVLAIGVIISGALTSKAESVEQCIAGASNSSESC